MTCISEETEKMAAIWKLITAAILITSSTQAQVQAQCGGAPDEWIQRGNSCYRVVAHESLDHSKAQAACVGQQAALVSIRDREENDFLITISTSHGVTSVWIGLVLSLNATVADYTNETVVKKRTRWAWLDNSPRSFSNWAEGEPNEPSGVSCARMWITDDEKIAGTWGDRSCVITFPYVCKKPVLIEGKTSTQTSCRASVSSADGPTTQVTLNSSPLPQTSQSNGAAIGVTLAVVGAGLIGVAVGIVIYKRKTSRSTKEPLSATVTVLHIQTSSAGASNSAPQEAHYTTLQITTQPSVEYTHITHAECTPPCDAPQSTGDDPVYTTVPDKPNYVNQQGDRNRGGASDTYLELVPQSPEYDYANNTQQSYVNVFPIPFSSNDGYVEPEDNHI